MEGDDFQDTTIPALITGAHDPTKFFLKRIA